MIPRGISPAALLTGIGITLVLLTAGGAVALVCPLPYLPRISLFMISICLAGLLWLGAVALVRGGRLPRRAVWIVLSAAVAMRVMSFATPPLLSSDIYRYVWDGRVEWAGINPYRFIPIDPELAFLRDDAVYPHINRAEYAHTIYAPAAQAVFALAAAVAPGVYGMKAVMAGFDILAIAALMALLRLAGRHPAELLIYAWLPLPVWEFVGNAHIDAVTAGLLTVALLSAARGKQVPVGIALAAAALTKYLPIVVVPAFWRPLGWRVPAAFIATLAALYLPYAGAGWQVLGSLGVYTHEEGFGTGHGVFLLQALATVVELPSWAFYAYAAAAVGVLAVIGWNFAFVSEQPAGVARRIEVQARQAAILGGVLLVAISPHYPWYFGWLAPLACLAPIPSVLWMLAAAPLLAHGSVEYLAVPAAVYVPAMALAVHDLYKLRAGTRTIVVPAARNVG